MEREPNQPYYQSLLKRHEGTIHRLRQERKREGLRLDGLKKALQTRLTAVSRDSNQNRAA